MKTTVTGSAGETVELGRVYGSALKPGAVVALFGDLGSGKTQFVKGVCAGTGAVGHVTSPTFTLINEYPAPFGTIAHVDLYRIGSEKEMQEIGLESYFRDDCICLIEWADRAMRILPAGHRWVKLAHGKSEFERVVSTGDDGEKLP
jgi:tRNA threonylcarbamoyladenosine biosynthesis protein TsaE